MRTPYLGQRLKRSEYPILHELPKKQQEIYTGKRCPWCGLKKYHYHRHHYPIPREHGGKQIVRICVECHLTYHNPPLDLEFTFDFRKCRTREEYDAAMRQAQQYCAKKAFPLAGAFIEWPYALVHALDPNWKIDEDDGGNGDAA